MSTRGDNGDKPPYKDVERRELEDRLRELGLDAQYWAPKLQKYLGVTSAQALQHLQQREILTLKSQAKHPWEKQALEKLFQLSSSQDSEKMQEKNWETVKKRQEWAQSSLRELREMDVAGKSRQEVIVREKEEELRQAMGIPPKYWPLPEKPLTEVIETMKRHLSLMESTLSHRENLSDRELLKRVSGGLALQGIYQTNHPEDLLGKREELLSLPENFFLLSPAQGTRMETKEFLSSHEESMFTESMEKLGFTVSFLAKSGGWGFSLEASANDTRSSNSREVHKSLSEHTYSCTTKFCYIPLAFCHFARDELRLSRSALQELKKLEELLSHSNGAEAHQLLKHRCEAFFQRFGSHVNQGPLHLGGVFWWKAVAEGFRSEELQDVRQQASEALDVYIGGSYSGFGLTAGAMVNASNSKSHMASHNTSSTNLQARFQMSVYQTGGPPEVDSLPQWKAGLVASNHTWCVIDRGYQLVPVWDIILSNHRQDFQDPLQLTRCLTDIYTSLTAQCARTQNGEELLSAVEDARSFLKEVKSWEITEPEEKLMKLLDFKQKLSEKSKNYNTWINICLKDLALQKFLVDIVNFCKDFPVHETKFIKSQLRSLLYPHVYQVEDFSQSQPIMQWVFHSAKEQQDIHVTEFTDLIQILEKTKNDLLAINHDSESLGKIEEAQRKATYEISSSLSSFLKTLKQAEESGAHLLLLSIAAGAGYKEENQTFHCLLGYEELNFLLCEMKEAHEKYQYLNKEYDCRAQAFLLLTGLTVTPGPTAVTAEEKMQRLKLMQSHMGQSWSKEVLHVLLKPRAGHDWETLEKDLNFLISGEYEATVNCIQMDQVKKELESVSQGKKNISEVEPSTIKYQEVIKNSKFLDLSKRLGLDHYYPRKMGRSDFHLIYKASVHDSQPDIDKQLPFYFLQKLLMLDYKLRYLVCKGDGDTMGGGILTPNLEANTSDPYDDLFDGKNTPPLLLSKDPAHIHPMDIQMMIFHCADDFMRQYISNKLSICQFALPLVVPNPCTSVIEFPLWSLSQIKRSWRQVEKSSGEDTVINFNNQFISQAPIPIVSFIRVVSSASSKSQILNSLLSKHKHDAFFHRHCRGSSKSCLLMGGMVEISWFCPGGRDEDRFERCVAFTNLRGDAKDYEPQLRFLQEISSVTVVLVSTSDKSERTVQIVRDLWKSTKPLIYLFDDKDENTFSDSGQKVRIGIRNRNEAELMDELTRVINCLLKSSGPFLSLEDCAEVARHHGFLVDVDRKECQEAKGKAQALLALMKEMKLSEMKERLLPLQGELWHQWCKKDKELCHLREKGNRSLEQHKSEIETEKQIIRQTQLKRAFPLNDLMRSVLEILQSHSEKDNTTELYFLQWLSMFMDNLTRGHLEKLQKKYNQLWSLVLAEKHEGSKNASLKHHQMELEAVSKEIRDSSLGIEHLLREVGQIYEALEEASSEMDTVFFSLPQIAADLMVSGYPLELMDGDASYVPLKWVAAVFDRLIEKIGDQKLFVLSVLGLQSTGKSTLLNAMFGLQFNVSAGRCTRGAYMQLLKVEDTLWEELGFGFVLVVDTEGLRAPEFTGKSQNRDNELATFVIGLGNLTLINIFGENPSEMQDILQIAVQAFLRMKQVNISPSCLFVHQNVGEITAKDQNVEGRRQLQERLDKMAATAAEQEQCSDITSFSDVIRFDVNTHVHYFAHLWEGDPPMAPPNPSYSHNIQELKRGILLAAKKESKGSILKMSEVKVRIHDLWKALVNENFIFSFRNTWEIMTMIKLETMYNNWTWNLRSHVLGLQNQLTNQIQNGEIQDLSRSSIEANIAEKYESIRQELQRYFDEDQENEILIQWKGNFENKLRNLKEALVSESIRKSKDFLSSRKSQDKLDQKKSEYEKELLLRSRDVALSLMGKELSEEELRDTFGQLWTKWVCEVSSTSPPAEDPNIDVDLENVFLEHFKQEWNVVSKLRDFSRKKIFSIDYEKHITMKMTYKFYSSFITESDKKSIMESTQNIISLVTETIECKLRMGMDYNISYFHEILRLIDKKTDSVSDGARYSFTNEYKIDLSLCLCHRAATKFRDMHTAFKRAHDPVTYLENKREDFFMSFKISCQGATSITAFADFLWSKLTASLPIAIWKKIALDLAGEIRANCPAFNGNRSNLEKHILISLAKEENFENYWEYINAPKRFFKNYIKKEIQAYCISRGNEKLKNFLSNSLEFFKKVILSAICEATLLAKDQNNSASVWLDTLCNCLGRHLTLPRGDLRSIEHQEIADIQFLKESMNEHLDTEIQKVGEACEVICIENVVPEIQAMLSDQLSGCWKQCPFCKAICTNTAINHCEDHSVPFHRSQTVTGTNWHKTYEFSIDICTSYVASDLFFVLNDDRSFPFKNYRQAGGEYATWNITPDTSAQPYWKWFVCRFRSELEDHYNFRFSGRGQIPDAWSRITKQDVLNDLNK